MERSVELNCSKCDGVFFRRNGNQKFCVKHYRFFAMMRGAKANGKKVPSWNELESMKGVDLVCPDCNDTMVWTRRESTTKAISLQHYRDGSMALVCFSCNSRHRDMPGDSYREMPKDHKRCPRCEEVKPVSLFYRSKDARIGNYIPVGTSPAGGLNADRLCDH